MKEVLTFEKMLLSTYSCLDISSFDKMLSVYYDSQPLDTTV